MDAKNTIHASDCYHAGKPGYANMALCGEIGGDNLIVDDAKVTCEDCKRMVAYFGDDKLRRYCYTGNQLVAMGLRSV